MSKNELKMEPVMQLKLVNTIKVGGRVGGDGAGGIISLHTHTVHAHGGFLSYFSALLSWTLYVLFPKTKTSNEFTLSIAIRVHIYVVS